MDHFFAVRVDHFLSVANTRDSSQKEQSRKGGATSHRESPSQRPERCARRGSVAFHRDTRRGSSSSRSTSKDNDDYRVVTFLDEATRQKEMIDAAHTSPQSRAQPHFRNSSARPVGLSTWGAM